MENLMNVDDDITQESIAKMIAESVKETIEEIQAEAGEKDPFISKSYNYHKPSAEGVDKITQLRKAFSDLDNLVRNMCPPSFQSQNAIMFLETAAMWAIKGVVLNDPKSEVAPS